MNNNDIVRRTDIINRLLDRAKPLRGLIHVDDVIRTINVAPSVKPQEPKTGHWILHTDASGNSWHACPACGHVAYTLTCFCPDCGARLEAPS